MPFRLFSNRPYYKGAISDHFDGRLFFNPWNPYLNSFLNLIRWKITAQPAPWPKHVKNSFADHPPQKVEGSHLRISFVGHSTVLIQTHCLNILTDPIWAKHASPFNLGWPGIKRVCNPGIAFDDLPKIDLVLISHNHYDHLDIKLIKRLWRRDNPLIITPLGNDTIIQAKDPLIKVETLDWHESYKVNHQVKVHLEPIQHWSGRSFWDRNKALWGAFVIEAGADKIFFCGDSGYHQKLFQDVRQKFGSFRLAMLPIGAYEPRWFMQYAHMNPEEAVLAHQDLGAPNTLSIHFQTFQLTDESYFDPVKDLTIAMKKHHIDSNRFRVLQVGKTWYVEERRQNTGDRK